VDVICKIVLLPKQGNKIAGVEVLIRGQFANGYTC